MGGAEDLLAGLRNNPKGVRFRDALKVAEHYFGVGRQTGSSHVIFSTPWAGDPRVNLQDDQGRAKAYQVKQLLKAIARLEAEREASRSTPTKGRKNE